MFAPALLALLALVGALEESPAYQEGLTLYQDLEFEEAVERFRAAAKEEGRSDEERATLLVWEAMSRAGVGDDDGAQEAARRALELHLDVTPPDIAPPKIREFLEQMRPEVEAEIAAAAAPSDPVPDEGAQETTSAAGEELPVMLIAGGAVAGLGVVGLASAGVVAALMASSLAAASDPEAFQIDASNAVDTANAQAIAAVIIGVGSVALVGAGVAIVAVDMLEE